MMALHLHWDPHEWGFQATRNTHKISRVTRRVLFCALHTDISLICSPAKCKNTHYISRKNTNATKSLCPESLHTTHQPTAKWLLKNMVSENRTCIQNLNVSFLRCYGIGKMIDKVTDFPEMVGGADSKASLNVFCGNWFQNKIYRNYTSCFSNGNLQSISLEMKGYGHASILTTDLLLDDFLK